MNERQLKTIKGAKYRVIKGDDWVFPEGTVIQLAENPDIDDDMAMYVQEGNSYGEHAMYYHELELIELPKDAGIQEQLASISTEVTSAKLTADIALDKVTALEQCVVSLEKTGEETEVETPEPLYAVGQKLRVKGNDNPVHHFYEIGTEVEVLRVVQEGDAEGKGSYKYYTSAPNVYFNQTISEADLEPAEQLHISEEEFAAIKVGDKIVLRSDLEAGTDYGSQSVNSEMVDLAKREVEITVERISADDLKGSAEGDFWWYTAEMIAKVIPAIKPKFKVGDIVTDDGLFFFARKIIAVDLEKAEYKWVWADGTDPGEEHTNSIERYDSEYTLHSSFEKPKPKFQVGDVLNRPEAGTDMDCARLVTEVDEENSEYHMQWADGSAPEYRMKHRFEDAEESFIKVEGLPPRMINPKGTVITAGNYYAANGTLYNVVLKVTEVKPENAEWEYVVTSANGRHIEGGFQSVKGSAYFTTAVPATPEQIEKFKQLENPEPVEEEKAHEFDNPEVEVGKVYMDDEGWMFYCDDIFKVEKQTLGYRKIYVDGVTALTPTGGLELKAHYGCTNYREATPEEAVKLLSVAFQDKAA